MKKVLSILLSVALIFTIMIPAKAAIEMDKIKVIADSFDNTVFAEFQKVTIKSTTVNFNDIEGELSIYLAETTKETIRNILIVDNSTIEFEMSTFNVPVGTYSVVLNYKKNNITMQQWAGKAIVVKTGRFIIRDEPLTVDSILTQGITARFYNVDIESEITAMIDGTKAQCTKITNRIFKIYPTEDQVLNKDNIEVRLIVPSGNYTKNLRIIKDEIYLEDKIYSRELPLSFYINSKSIEFPINSEDISVVITGHGRYIDISDISIYNNHKIRAYTKLPLATGTYNMAVTWKGTTQVYNLTFDVVKQVLKDNYDLDQSILDFLKVDDKNVELTLFDNQIYRYVNSQEKVIDLTKYPFEYFELDLRNNGLEILLENNLGLTINFKDYQFIIPKEALDKIATKDGYIVVQKTKEFPKISAKYYELSDNLYIDSNIVGLKVFGKMKSNVKTYQNIEALVENTDFELNIENAYLINDKMYFTYKYPGTYKFVVKPTSFSDVYETYWGLKYISPLVITGIINGMGDGTFLPEGKITNAQFTKLVATAIDMLSEDGLSYFQDIYTTSWYYKYVAALENANIIGGDFFHPESYILRKDMAVMVMKAYAYYSGENLQDLANKSTAHFNDIGGLTTEEQQCIFAAQYLGIIEGMNATTYAPDNTATRAQAATIIYRLMKVLDLI